MSKKKHKKKSAKRVFCIITSAGKCILTSRESYYNQLIKQNPTRTCAVTTLKQGESWFRQVAPGKSIKYTPSKEEMLTNPKLLSRADRPGALKQKKSKKPKFVHKYNTFQKCMLCDRPITNIRSYCIPCRRKLNELDAFIKSLNPKLKGLSRQAVVVLKYNFIPEGEDVFDYIHQHPEIIYKYFDLSKEERTALYAPVKDGRFTDLEISLDCIPNIINDFFRDNPEFTLVDVYGTNSCPYIKAKYLDCDELIDVKFFDFNRYPNKYIKNNSYASIGELTIATYLTENNISFKTQFDTIRCENPKTGYQLPYDFELENKIIIEVQGSQHFKYTEYFHKTEEAFEYQKYKDNLKRDFALAQGYTYLELKPEDFNTDNYILKLNNALNSNKT